MSYGLVDDELHLNRKVRGFTSDEFRLWMMAISYSRKHKTHGHLTDDDVEVVGRGQLLRRPKVVLAGLLKKRGFDRTPDGYRVHDWDAMPYDRLSQAGQTGASARWNKTEPMRSDMRSHPNRISDSDATGDAMTMPRAGTPSPTPTPIESPNGLSKEKAQAQRVLDTWAVSKGKTAGELKLTKDRLRVINARLQEGYSDDDLEAAACGWQNDPREGRRQQNELEILLRDGGQVEKFRDLWRNGPPATALFKPGGTVARSQARRQAFEHLADALGEAPQLSEGA